MVSFTIKQGSKIVCWIYSCAGDYGKPYLIITNNSSGTDYFQDISDKFEHELDKRGLQSLMCEYCRNCRSYRLPDDSWWNEKEKRWYKKEEWTQVLEELFTNICSEMESKINTP